MKRWKATLRMAHTNYIYLLYEEKLTTNKSQAKQTLEERIG